MTVMRWILAVGSGAAFALSGLLFASALADHRAQGCRQVAGDMGNANCADAVMTMRISAIVALCMLGVLGILLRQLRHGGG